MSFERDDRHAEGNRGTLRARSRETGWPVLATLPRVGRATAAPREPLPTFAVEADAAAEPPLRVDDGAVAGDHWRFAVDAAHEGPAPPPEPAVAAPQPTRRPVEPVTTEMPETRGARHYRIDHAGGPLSAARGPHARQESESVSASIFRLHAALAPHMGTAATAALVLAAGLLYWLAAGRTAAVMEAAQPAELGAEWTPTGAIEPVTAPAVGVEVEVKTRPAGEMDFTPAPARVADASAGVRGEATTQAEAPVGGATEEIEHAPAAADAAGNSGPALGPPAVMHEVQRTPADDGDAIGPTAQGDDYPTTSYPPFWFDAQVVAQGPAPVAEGGVR